MRTIETEDELEDMLSEPTPAVVSALGRLTGDILILGASGKMGPTLARMARRASDLAQVDRRVFGVARFSSGSEARLQANGIETVRCDLQDEDAVARLPEAPNVIFMTGMKFGTTGDEATTWAMNSFVPGLVCRRYRRSRIVAFSTGNVYGLSSITAGGSRESDRCQPVGEYAMSCLGRERLFEYFGRSLGIPTVIIRLNYAGEMRYGVLVDLAQRVFTGDPVDLGMGYFNTIWQGDANAMALCAFDAVAIPPCVVNVTGPEQLSTRTVAEHFGRLMSRPVTFTGTESQTALLSDARRGLALWGPPRVSADQMIEWVADWVSHGNTTLGKPTHFDSRDGNF